MKRLLNPVISICFLAASVVAAATAPALAKPNGSVGAQTASGTGCLVRDANGAYHFDPECRWHTVARRDRNGNLVLYSYHDQGNLPPNAPRPSSAIQHSGPWPGCPDGINEVTTPSGQYRSDCRFHN